MGARCISLPAPLGVLPRQPIVRACGNGFFPGSPIGDDILSQQNVFYFLGKR